MKRILFKSEEIRDAFFAKCLKKFEFKKWKELYEFLESNRKTFTDYRTGKRTFPENLYLRLISKFSNTDILSFENSVSYLDENWGRVKAGKTTYSKHKHIFEEGRKKAIKSNKKRVHKFDINLPLTSELAYFIGLFIGDGFTNKYGRYYLTQFVGHFPIEVKYYQKIISKISFDLFGIKPIIKKDKKCNAIRINFYSKDLYDMITKRFNINAGRKSSIVKIPKEILDSGDEIVLACVAGLYDAEGSLYFDKRQVYKKPYPILEFHVFNENLIKQVSKVLDQFGIKNYVRNLERIYFYGKKNIKSFLKKVELNNPKILDKIKF